MSDTEHNNIPAFVARYASENYYGGCYDDAGLRAVISDRKRYAVRANTDYRHYSHDGQQRYWLINEQFSAELQGTILDVGSRHNTLRELLKKDAQLVDKHNPLLPDFDWETAPLPFADNSFDTVVCLDTLEHIDKIHLALDDLVRVSNKYIIVSLPNCWRTTTREVLSARSRSASYGLPPESPHDRHKWYFNSEDIEGFMFYNAQRLGLTVRALCFHAPRRKWTHTLLHGLVRVLPERYFKNLLVKTVFVCLEKPTSA
jgi:Methyltransferase domain